MKAQGKTIVIITHKLEEVLAISDNVTVMRDGKTVGNVPTSETNAKDLARMIVGRDVLLRVEKTDAQPKDSVLNIENLSVKGKHGLAIDGISFNVRAGEIVGIAGIDAIDIYKANVLAGLFVGGMIPFIFSALCIQAVGRAAMDMVE